MSVKIRKIPAIIDPRIAQALRGWRDGAKLNDLATACHVGYPGLLKILDALGIDEQQRHERARKLRSTGTKATFAKRKSAVSIPLAPDLTPELQQEIASRWALGLSIEEISWRAQVPVPAIEMIVAKLVNWDRAVKTQRGAHP